MRTPFSGGSPSPDQPPSRRGFLKGFAAFSAGSTAAVAVVASAATGHPDAGLLARGAQLDRALSAYLACDAELQRAIERFKPVEPPVPDGLVMDTFNRLVETDWLPGPLGAPNAYGSNRTRIAAAWDLDRRVQRLDGRTRAGREVRRLKKLSDAYHETHKAARDAAGTNQADHERDMARVALASIVAEIEDAKAGTLAGLAVKGRAMIAWERIKRIEGGIRQRDATMRFYEEIAALGRHAGAEEARA